MLVNHQHQHHQHQTHPLHNASTTFTYQSSKKNKIKDNTNLFLNLSPVNQNGNKAQI